MNTIRWKRASQIRAGGVVVMMAFLLPAVLILAAFSINLAYMELVQTELQIATDASCRAAAKKFSTTGDQTLALAAAQSAASRNTVAGKPLPINADDLRFGFASRSGANLKYNFDTTTTPYNAVHIDADSVVATGSGLQLPFRFGMQNAIFRPLQTATAAQVELDVCLVVDRSGSMAFGSDEVADPMTLPKRAPVGWMFGQAVPPQSRWSEAVDAVDAFLTVLNTTPQQERVALATYNHIPTPELPLATSYTPIAGRLATYTAAFNAGGTNIGDGLIQGIDSMTASPQSRPWAVKAAIVLTDGIHNWGTDPISAAYYAADQKVVLYTVSFSQEADQWRMEEVARIGAGKHFHATNRSELIAAFESIAHNLPLLLTE